MRVLVSFLLIVTLLVGAPAPAGASACQDDDANAASSSLQLIEEGFRVLSRLFVEPVSPATLLTAALGAVHEELAWEESPLLEPMIGDLDATSQQEQAWNVFAVQYCELVTARPDHARPPNLAYPALDAMADALDEGHTRFMTPRMYEDHLAWSSGDLRYEGIGARLRGNPLTVDYVFSGSPAEAAGLLLGDRILAIDGEPSEDMAATDAVLLIRGEAGTVVNLTLARDGEQLVVDLPILRGSIRVPAVEARMIDEVGYLAIRGFPGPSVYEDVVEELAAFQSAGVQALVMDLRGNSGGRLDVGERVAALFLPEGTPVYRRTTRQGRTATETTASSILWAQPVAVLIDSGTASMGEILAAALQEQGTAPLIGTTTAGSVAGSLVVPLSDGSAVQVTTLRIDSGQGRILNRIGVPPDTEIEVSPTDLRSGLDEPLDTALAYLRSQLRARGTGPQSATPPFVFQAERPSWPSLAPAASVLR